MVYENPKNPKNSHKKIVVWFSCGAASAISLKITIEKFGKDRVIAVNNPVKEEDEDNRRFLIDIENWLDIKIQESKNPVWPNASAVEVWNKKKFMSSPYGAPCTAELKKKAREYWEIENGTDNINVLGFTYEEKHRAEDFALNSGRLLWPILVTEGLTKSQCFIMLKEEGIELPEAYKKGMPNANCIGCVKSTSPTYWNLIRSQYPKVFEERVSQSSEIGAKLVRVKGERIMLKDLSPDDSGAPLKNMYSECGIFC